MPGASFAFLLVLVSSAHAKSSPSLLILCNFRKDLHLAYSFLPPVVFHLLFTFSFSMRVQNCICHYMDEVGFFLYSLCILPALHLQH